jgi:hypothetical protein
MNKRLTALKAKLGRLTPAAAKERKALIGQLEWNSGGWGFGICSFANEMTWALDQPSKDNPDLKSVVAICGEPKKYTTEELRRIVEFSKAATERYDKMFKWRRGCNLILLDKWSEASWMRKRLTWHTAGYSPSLEEALAVFEKDWKNGG